MDKKLESTALALIGADRLAARSSVLAYIGSLKEGLTRDGNPDLERVIAAASGRSVLVSTARVAQEPLPPAPVASPPVAAPPQHSAAYYAEIERLARAHWDREIGNKPQSGDSNMKITMSAADLKADIVEEWKTKPHIRGEFSNFGAYQAYRENQFCKEHGLRREALKGALVDVDAHVASLNQARKVHRENVVDSHELEEIKGRAAEWEASMELRSEFGSFGAYDSYQRWHKQGRVKYHTGTGGLS